MERLALACGGFAVNSFDDLTEDALGYADAAYEHVLGEDKFTFVEGCRKANSCTILIKGTPMPRCILVRSTNVAQEFAYCTSVIQARTSTPFGKSRTQSMMVCEQ